MKPVTDQALFGKSVGPTHPPHSDESRQQFVDSARAAFSNHPTPPSTKPAEKEFSVAMTVFRIQQSLCLFPLGESHFKHPGEKLKYLLSERGLLNKEREADLKQVTAELVRQSQIMAEAVEKYAA